MSARHVYVLVATGIGPAAYYSNPRAALRHLRAVGVWIGERAPTVAELGDRLERNGIVGDDAQHHAVAVRPLCSEYSP